MMSWHLRYFQHQSRCQGVTLSVSAIQVARQSRLYESAPAYVTDQPRFINAALAVETALPPMELLRALKRIEVPLFWHRTVAVNACSQSHQIGAHKSKHDFVAITQSFETCTCPSTAITANLSDVRHGVYCCRQSLGGTSRARDGGLGHLTWTSSSMKA